MAQLVSLDDKYEARDGTVLISGVQALVRLPIIRHQLDVASGINTAGFVSGYRGSPLGTYNSHLRKAQHLLDANRIRFTSAVNEELGATAVWGTQYVPLYRDALYDGVFGIWYGKGPGVDRAGDAFKHANFFGTSRHGGVLAIAGDDHACKSSSMPNQSEFAFIDAEIPVLHPADIDEVLEFGVKGIALSRFAGLWVGMKAVADTLDSTATVSIDYYRYRSVEPAFAFPSGGLNARLGDSPRAQEERHRKHKLAAAQEFARANAFDRIVIDGPNARFGIMATGKAYLHVRQALRDLGISDDRAAELGIRILKVGLVWPLDPKGALAFADGLHEVFVVEERRDVLEHQLKAITHHLPDDRRPRVIGKHDVDGQRLLSDLADLDTDQVARALLTRFPDAWMTGELRTRQAALTSQGSAIGSVEPLHKRSPFFCSGCPHNTSTNLPGGSRAMAGIGCHFLVQWMDRNTEVYTHMGGEGVPWVGQAPFTSEHHIFANLGDGTYFHSGTLAIRQAIAAGVNITYKILYNDAVAMTGGQPVDGFLSVPKIVAQLVAEGVTRIAIVSDQPDKHRGDPLIPTTVTFDHRDRLDAVQRQLREVAGCSALIYDQGCATELRRRRKRGLVEKPRERLYINEAVCEGCGDCSVASNCISIEPVDTEFGQKRQIDQSSCNQDSSCVGGFCPSFVSVSGTAKKREPSLPTRFVLSEPMPPAVGQEGYNILLAGIGGEGVTSLSAIIGMAAHIDGKAVRIVDQLGMAQKGGGVQAHIRLAREERHLQSPRIGLGQADLLIASDMVVAHGDAIVPQIASSRTHAIINGDIAPTGQFVRDNATLFDRQGMMSAIRRSARSLDELRATEIVGSALGDRIYVNIFLLGYAFQRGFVPLTVTAVEQAIELNGTAVDENKNAFALGRQWALKGTGPVTPTESRSLDEIVAIRVRELTAYASRSYAREYKSFVRHVAAAEARIAPNSTELAIAVASNLFKLMAYKDEYEVARLYVRPEFREQLRRQFGDGVGLRFHMAPPLLSRRDPNTGLLRKRTFGPWLFPALRVLARLKFLRGTSFDIFGYSPERRLERTLVRDYRDGVSRILACLTPDNIRRAIDYARVPELIRGFGHVKMTAVEKARITAREIEMQLCERPAMTAAEYPRISDSAG